MTELERFKKLKELGYEYEPQTGLVKRNSKERGGKNKLGYIQLGIKTEKKLYMVLAHRFIWWLIHNEIPDVIDHINHITSDNRLCNLRNVNKQKNSLNRRSKGYSYHKASKKYRAQIKIDQKIKHLGLFNTEQEARQAYLTAKKIHHII